MRHLPCALAACPRGTRSERMSLKKDDKRLEYSSERNAVLSISGNLIRRPDGEVSRQVKAVVLNIHENFHLNRLGLESRSCW